MLPRLVTRRTRPMWLAALATVVWTNRHDVQRWVRFLRRAGRQRHQRAVGELLTETRVRLAVTRDPLLRRDPAIDDVCVDDGVVTLITTTASWPDPRDQVWRLKSVRGITDVTTRPA